MQLYLIRHAESENNAKPAYARVEDPGLTARGKQQAACLANWMKTVAIDVLITSPFLRTLQTSRVVLDESPQKIHVWHDVFERGGVFRGHGPDAVEGGPGLNRQGVLNVITGADCVIDDSIGDEGWWNSKRRETDDEVVERAKSVTTRLVTTFGNTDQAIALITHADFKRCLLQEMAGAWLDLDQVGLLKNTGITKLVHGNDRWTLESLNSDTHLPERLGRLPAGSRRETA